MPTFALLLAIIGTPCLAAALILVPNVTRRWRGRLALLAPALVSVLGVALWQTFGTEQRLTTFEVDWLSTLGITAGLAVDRLAAFFVLLVGLIGVAIVQYARAYLGRHATGGFWALLLTFMAAMLGVVLSDSFVLFFVFWELTTVTSALLIGWHNDEPEARRGGIQAFLVTSGGSLVMLAGMILLGVQARIWSFSALVAQSPSVLSDSRHVLPLVLILIGAFAKSAQVPFHFWLPDAMAAPAPVTAYLHSATMVKAGVFLVGRLLPAYSSSPIWLPLLATVGLTTFVVAGWSALRSHDVKRLLAYATCSYLGLLIAQYGFAARGGAHSELLNIANHATYKSALFLLAGWVEKSTGTRDLRHLTPQKWMVHSPAAAVLTAFGILAMSGIPLLLGFFSKELFFDALLAEPSALPLTVGVIGSGLTLAYSLRILIEVFYGSEPPPTVKVGSAHPVSRWLLAVPAILLLPQILGGLLPGTFVSPLVDSPGRVPQGPAFWRHSDPELWMSLAAFAAGLVLFELRQHIHPLPRLGRVESTVRLLKRATLSFCSWFGRVAQAGGHPRYVSILLLSAVAAVLLTALLGARPRLLPAIGPEGLQAWVPGAIVVGAAIGATRAGGRIAKAIALAIAGYGVALFYVMLRAPDLALTQLLVETLTFVLLLLAFRHLPRLGPDRRRTAQKVAHGLVALAVGVTFCALAWAIGSQPAGSRSGPLQLQLAEPQGHGRNAVNVVLVDMRAADTLGEITVLAIAAIGIMALIGRRREVESGPQPKPPPLLLYKVSQIFLPVSLVYAAYLLLYGHDRPGGGFSAGLVTALALVIYSISAGRERAHTLLMRRLRPLLPVGLMLAVASGLYALAWGEPFLTHHHLAGAVAVSGLSLSTALLFDVGVYCIVIGIAAAAISRLGAGARSEP